MPCLGLGLGTQIPRRVLFTGLLDEFSGAAAAYSLRALSAAWLAGDVVEVRRSSDSSTQSFTAGQVADGTLEAFCGVGDGFVSTWYDQSGNGNNATQATTTAQPKIVSAGSLVTGGIDFDGVDDQLDGTGITASLATMISVSKLDTSAGFSYAPFVVGGSDATAGSESFLSYYRGASTTHAAYQGTVLDSAVPYLTNTTYLKFDVLDDANSELFVNGSSIATGATGTKTASNAAFSIGRARGSSNLLDGKIAEVIFYPSNQSANRAGIETNINDYYSIY